MILCLCVCVCVCVCRCICVFEFLGVFVRACAHTRVIERYEYNDSKTWTLTYQHADDDTKTFKGDSTEESVSVCESVRRRRERACTHERQSERK